VFDSIDNHPTLVTMRTQARVDALRQEAEAHRLLKQARTGAPGFQDRLLLNVGDGLISLGCRLKARCEPNPAVSNLHLGQAG